MRTVTMALTCVSFVIGSSGCGTAARRVLSEVRGASAKAQAVPGTSTARLVQFQGVKIGSPRTDLGPLVDSRFTNTLPGAVRTALTQGKDPMFPGGAPTLEIDPQITWYHEAGGLGGLLGSDSYAVVLFWLASEGNQLGKI